MKAAGRSPSAAAGRARVRPRQEGWGWRSSLATVVTLIPARSVCYLTYDTRGGLERVRAADLGVCRLPVADLRTNTGLEWGPGRRRRSGGSAP
jgi:hypothetical protein